MCIHGAYGSERHIKHSSLCESVRDEYKRTVELRVNCSWRVERMQVP